MNIDKDVDGYDVDSGSDIDGGNNGFRSTTTTTYVSLSIFDTIVDTVKEDTDKDIDAKTITSFLQIQIWLQKTERRGGEQIRGQWQDWG